MMTVTGWGSWARRFSDEDLLAESLLGIDLKINIRGGVSEAGLGCGTIGAMTQTTKASAHLLGSSGAEMTAHSCPKVG